VHTVHDTVHTVDSIHTVHATVHTVDSVHDSVPNSDNNDSDNYVKHYGDTFNKETNTRTSSKENGKDIYNQFYDSQSEYVYQRMSQAQGEALNNKPKAHKTKARRAAQYSRRHSMFSDKKKTMCMLYLQEIKKPS